MKHRNWVFTINNPTQQVISLSCQIKFLCATLEIGESGTTHYQGYLELQTSRTLEQTQRLLLDHAHLEPRRGTKAQALSYVQKSWSEELQTSDNSVNIFDGLTSPIQSSETIDSSLQPIVVIGFGGTWKELHQLSKPILFINIT